MRVIAVVILALGTPTVALAQAAPAQSEGAQPPQPVPPAAELAPAAAPTPVPPAAELAPAAPAPIEPSAAPAPPPVAAPAPAPAPAATPAPPQPRGAVPPAPHWDASRDPRWNEAPPNAPYYGRRSARRTERPRRLPYDGGPPPPGYRTVSSSIKALWIPGLAVGTGTYLLSMLIGSIANDRDGDGRERWLAVPVLGPWIAVASSCPVETDYYGDEVRCGLSDDLLIFSGVMQAMSLTAVILGVTLKRKHYVLTDYSQLRILPSTMARSGYGLVLDGRF